MTTPLETIVLGLLLVVLLSYRRRFRAPLDIRNLLLPMWCPEPTLTCISYSSTRPLSFTWMTCVSVSAEAGVHPHLHPQGHVHVRPVVPVLFGITATLMASTGSLTRITPPGVVANTPGCMTNST